MQLHISLALIMNYGDPLPFTKILDPQSKYVCVHIDDYLLTNALANIRVARLYQDRNYLEFNIVQFLYSLFRSFKDYLFSICILR